MSDTTQNLVFELKLHLESGIVSTGIRVFDLRSFNLINELIHAKSFGRVSAKRFVLHLHSGGDLWSESQAIPMRVKSPSGSLTYVPIALVLLGQYYARREAKQLERAAEMLEEISSIA